MNDQSIRGSSLNSPSNSKFHILEDVLDIGAVYALYVKLSTPPGDCR